jgi:arylsulfatase A-like enzyme
VVRERTRFLLEDLPRADRRSRAGPDAPWRTDPTKVRRDRWRIGGVKRDVLFVHPETRVVFPGVPVHARARLRFSVALDPQAWTQAGDGVEFTVAAREGEQEEVLYRRQVDPKARPGERAWLEAEVDLAARAGRNVDLVFATSAGPAGDDRFDWAGFGDPVLESEGQEVRAAAPPRPDVILVSIDTLRADRLGLHGYRKPTTPRLEELARESVVFDTVYGATPTTLASHMTMMTALHPLSHNVGVADLELDEGVPTLAEAFRAAGYATVGMTDGGWASGRYGLNRGFDVYEDRGGGGLRAHLKRALRVLETRPDVPHFLFVHTYDVHGPYEPPPPYDTRFYEGKDPRDPANRSLDLVKRIRYHDYLGLGDVTDAAWVSALYDGGIAAMDAELGWFVDELRASKLLDAAVLAVTSDHGESMLEHGVWIGHGLFLYEEELRVPLLLRLPKGAHGGRRVPVFAGNVDLAPTLLSAAGLPPLPGAEGRDLLPAARGEDAAPRPVFGLSPGALGQPVVREGKWKLIGKTDATHEFLCKEYLKAEPEPELVARLPLGEQLFDLEADPGETRNLAAAEPEVAARLRGALTAWWDAMLARMKSRGTGKPAAPLTPEEEARLRSLGYPGGPRRVGATGK